MIERRRKQAVQLVTDAPRFYGAVYGAWLDTHSYDEAAAIVDDELSATAARRAVVLMREAANAPTLPDATVATLAKAIADAREDGPDAEFYVGQIEDGRL